MWQGPGFSRMLVVSNRRTPIRHTPYLQPHRHGEACTEVVGTITSGLLQHYSILFVSVKGGKRKTFALVLPKEFTLLQADVMHFISRAAPVGAVPLVCRTHTPLPATNQEISLPIQGKTGLYITEQSTAQH